MMQFLAIFFHFFCVMFTWRASETGEVWSKVIVLTARSWPISLGLWYCWSFTHVLVRFSLPIRLSSSVECSVRIGRCPINFYPPYCFLATTNLSLFCRSSPMWITTIFLPEPPEISDLDELEPRDIRPSMLNLYDTADCVNIRPITLNIKE